MEAAERERFERLMDAVHACLLTGLVALRPLVWDGDIAAPANLVYLALIPLALFACTVEVLVGTRRVLRWSWTGLAAVLFVLALVPAALHAPVPPVGAAFWWQLALHIGFGAYLMQVVAGRERLLWAALATGLAAEVAITLVQGAVVLPAMAAATASDSLAVAAEGVAGGDLAERIANGGWFGTFTLSNTLAAWLLLAAVPLAGAAWRAGPRGIGVAYGLLAGAAGVVLLATRSKGALLALLLVAGLWWLLRGRGWTRWLPLPLGLAGLLVLALLPGSQRALEASAQVRLGYWQGAVELVREAPLAGHGIGAFAARSSAVLPSWAEPSKLVHNEPLELAVVAGIPLATVLVLLLLVCAWPRRGDAGVPGEDALPDGDGADIPFVPAAEDVGGTPVDGASPAAPPVAAATVPPTGYAAPAVFLVGLFSYLALFRVLDGNLGWWPGGGSFIGQWLWSVVIAGAMAAFLVLQRDARPSARWWLRMGMAALLLHCLTDFDLHSYAVVGTLITVAVLAGRPRTLAVPNWSGLAGLALVAVLGFGGLRWAWHARDLGESDDLVRALRLLNDPAHRDDGIQSLAWMLDQPQPQPGDRRAFTELIGLAVVRARELAADDPVRQVQVLAYVAPSAARLAELDALLPRAPYLLTLARLRAADYAALDRWEDAVAEARRGVALAPSFLPQRQELSALLQNAIIKDQPRAARWRDEREVVEREIAELKPVVNFRNRAQ